MPDDSEISSTFYEAHCHYAVAKVRNNAATMPIGRAGICDICDEYSLRLVAVTYRDHQALSCATCRDTYKLG